MPETFSKIEKGKTQFLMGIDKPDQLTEWLAEHTDIVGVAFVGRSNVGKSTLINSIFGKSTARVSNTPGRTRQVNIFDFPIDDHRYFLFDLPGYGHAKVSKEMSKNWNTLMDIFFNTLSEKVVIINLQDARHPNQDSDQGFYKYINNFPFSSFLVLNKIDKLKRQKDRHLLKNKIEELFKHYKKVQQFHYVSAVKGRGIEGLQQALISFLLEHQF